MKHILVPTDFSDCALAAAKTAVFLAKKMGATLHFYSNIFIHEYYDYYTESQQKSLKEESASIQEVEQKFENLFSELDLEGINVLKKYSEGHIFYNILNYVEKYEIDLIVMGTHGLSGINEWVIGSTTQKVVRKASCPVLSVKYIPDSFRFENIIFLSDFDEEAKVPFATACAFAEKFESKVHLLNIDTPTYFTEIPFVIRKSMNRFADLYKGVITKNRIDAWNVEGGLKKFLGTHEADLVVVPTHGKKGLRGLFFNSIAEGIVNHFDIPVMTLKF